jgi:hypothetical protein
MKPGMTQVGPPRAAWAVAFALGAALAACGETPLAPVSRPDGATVFDDASAAQCVEGERFCADRCVRVATDPDHCGDCNQPCTDGTFCQGGSCVRTCPAGLVPCAGGCVDLLTDEAHCGRCGGACASDRTCTSGACGCAANTIECGGACADVDRDDANCGICGRTCRADQACVAGSCACRGGLTACGDACVDQDQDRENCGICGRRCAADQSCARGSCVCATGTQETACSDGADDDCDRLVDCADPDCSGATRRCAGRCGPGVETCDGAGRWGTCEGGSGGAEICGDGIDQDCSGADLRSPDRFEPNDTCATATLVSNTPDPDITLTPSFDSVDDDVDCFRFIAEDSSNPLVREYVEVRLTNIPSGHDYDVFLYRDRAACDARMSLASAVAAGNADDVITWAESFGTDDAGTYYVRVVRIVGASCRSSYSLQIRGLR